MDGIAIKAMVKELAPVIREYAEAAQAPLLERITSLETEKTALASRCKALEEAAAKTVEIDLTPVEKLIEAEIAKIPVPEPAKELDREEVAAMVNDAVAALPAPQDGKSVEIEEVLPAIAAEVARVFEAYPVPRDGEPGKDGRGVKDLLIDRDGQLIATMDDGEMKTLGPIIGKDGESGKDGRDGIALDSFEAIVLDDDRTIELKFVSGEIERVASFKWPVPIDCGVYKAGEQYERGDAVTWGGSLWLAQRDTSEKPDTPDSGWRLAVKRGRDGKDAKVG
jgi:hypothetical protein